MHPRTKKSFYDDFLNQWGEKFNKLPALIEFLEAYYYLGEQMDEIKLIESHMIQDYQMEWVSLIGCFDHPIEKNYFKSFWVPISKENYEYFLDLSDSFFRIFKIGYWGIEPMHWFSEDVIPDLSDYIIGLEDGSIGLKNPTEDEDGNPLDQDGNQLLDQNSQMYRIPCPDLEFTGYDSVSIYYQMTEVVGHILESPIEERLIKQFNYMQEVDNSLKPYQAWWIIEDKKFKLHLVNAYINETHYYTNDIVPEYDDNNVDSFFHYKYNGRLQFVVDQIREPGYFSHNLKPGDKIYISIEDGIVTDLDKR
ncbi:hypothetical protein [Draconibacterium sediminis]|uniref:hypothetical protein n=1 Tax=Draconibacterium sediminis TaxID=1544798 RepID=UPI0026F00B68|nr:hypothetical protein [Draconibacterium sediminis]